MARKLRLEFPGACYHVTNRGNCRTDLIWTPGAGTRGSTRVKTLKPDPGKFSQLRQLSRSADNARNCPPARAGGGEAPAGRGGDECDSRGGHGGPPSTQARRQIRSRRARVFGGLEEPTAVGAAGGPRRCRVRRRSESRPRWLRPHSRRDSRVHKSPPARR